MGITTLILSELLTSALVKSFTIQQLEKCSCQIKGQNIRIEKLHKHLLRGICLQVMLRKNISLISPLRHNERPTTLMGLPLIPREILMRMAKNFRKRKSSLMSALTRELKGITSGKAEFNERKENEQKMTTR